MKGILKDQRCVSDVDWPTLVCGISAGEPCKAEKSLPH